jgi:hypothetical protein
LRDAPRRVWHSFESRLSWSCIRATSLQRIENRGAQAR